MKTWQIDPAAPEAQRTLRHFRELLFPSDAPVDTERGLWWVAEEPAAGLLAGFAGMHFNHQGDPLTAYLCLAGVLPEYRGQGIQRRLIQARLRKARVLGLRRVVTDTIPDNPASINSLVSCGFRAFSPAVPWEVPGAAYWERRLV